MQALVSIHDVMPETMDRVATLISHLSHLPNDAICLLVVPGLDWQPEAIQQLADWQQQGYELAGHGWLHRTDDIRGFYHRLHSTFISRNVAEHLALDASGVAALLQRNYDWFAANGLASPELYVPPAWAMGRISEQQLRSSPFRYFEDTGGLRDIETGYRRLPLTGFEADNLFRREFLRVWNRLNVALSSAKRPVRISLHPYDLEYQLGDRIPDLLKQVSQAWNYRALF